MTRKIPNYLHLKLGMKFPGGTVYEVERQIGEGELNMAVDGHGVIRVAIQEMFDEFMERLPRERDAL